MFKKMFALASVTALTGLVATVAAAGCSSTTTVAGDGPETGVVTTHKEGGGPPVIDQDSGADDSSTAAKPEEMTVGKLCSSSADCKVAGSVNDNDCSKGVFGAGGKGGDDLFGDPVCIQGKCTQGTAGTIADILCDGDAMGGPGLCLPNNPSDPSAGICFPFCSYDSTMVVDKCAGGNKCNIAYLGTDAMMKTAALGFCFGACQADTDCKGTTGNKCQKEDGLCVATPVTYAKAVGAGCNAAAMTAECNCNRVGNHADGGVSPDADKGICTHACVTGAAGDAVCGAALTGWKCTAKLPTMDEKGQPAFTGQPDDVSGQCALPCTADTDCAALGTSSGLNTLLKCRTFAGGKFCDPTAD